MARLTHDDQVISDKYYIADAALFILLELTYNWKLANIDFTVTSKPPEQPSKPPEQHKVG